MEFRLEVVLLPVADVDRAKAFYEERCGWRLDVDHRPSDDFRVVQLTPPGSSCSVSFGLGITDAEPGSVRGTHLVVQDIEAACAWLAEQGVEVDPPRHMTEDGWQDGAHPEHVRFASFSGFADPDGNTWVLQEVGHPDEPADRTPASG